MPKIDQQICIVIEKDRLRKATLTYPPRWDSAEIDRSYGMVRDFPRAVEALEKRTDLPRLKEDLKIDEIGKRVSRPGRAYDVGARRNYHQHVGSAPEKKFAALAVGNGNLLNNLGIVGWADGRLFKVAGEERRINSGWKYCCFYTTKAHATGIAQFTFETGSPKSCEILNGEVEWVTSGQPILWDGVVADPKDLIAETYDVRHVYRLPATVGQDEVTQKQARETIGELTERWLAGFDQPIEQTVEILRKLANHKGLVPEDRYLMSALGADPAGNIYIVQRHGSMSQIARVLSAAGATRAILLDQGGSVGTFYWNQVHRNDGDFIFSSRDFRHERLSVIVFAVDDLWDEA